jgi:hypothetical protein
LQLPPPLWYIRNHNLLILLPLILCLGFIACPDDTPTTPPPPPITFNVSDTAEWNDALIAIAGGGNNKEYIINVTDDFSVPGRSTPGFGSASGIKVTLQGQHTLSLSGNGRILYIASNQTVIMRNLTLRGHSSNDRSLVYVGYAWDGKGNKDVGGIFTMESGEISGNIGGGVSVGETGNFTMNGGEISGNTSPEGGGVHMYNSSDDSNITFTMNGGKISNNKATMNSYNGGGGVYVYVYNSGYGKATFTMNGGEISDNTSSSGGGGVYVGDYNDGGTFIMRGGKISGNTSAYSGGGMSVGGSTFIMNGGEISGNTANEGGGGVFSFGTFRIVTGTIYGSNEADTSIRNTASEGAALYGTASYGQLLKNGSWYENGTLSSTDNTIRVVNGVLQ